MNFKNIEHEELLYNENYMQNAIKKGGFSFEGKKFPYSIQPLLISQKENNYFLKSTEILSECLEIILQAYKSDNYIKNFFSYYKNYEDLLSINQKGRNIVISRFDVVWYGGEDYKIFECNTCCPGGISILGKIKKEYLELPLIKKYLSGKKIIPFVCDSTDNFIMSLVKQYNISCDYTPTTLGIAFANHKGFYTYELKEFVENAKKMGFNAVTCDLKELKNDKDGRLLYNNIEINIVYNKVDQLMLDKKLLQPVLNAINSGKAISVNPFPAMYITESKLVLALLHDEFFQKKYLNKEQIELIIKHIPWTRKLEEQNTMYQGNEISLLPYIKEHKDSFVIKIDNETRGSNIFIGKDSDPNFWENLIHNNKNKNWIVQEYCNIPKIEIPVFNDKEITFEERYFGIDFFMFNGKYSGIVSRISEKKIINVGSGGFEQPVLLIDKY